MGTREGDTPQKTRNRSPPQRERFRRSLARLLLAMPDDAGSIRVAVEELISTAGYERAAADPDEPFACGVLQDGSSPPQLADSVAELLTLALTLTLPLP